MFVKHCIESKLWQIQVQKSTVFASFEFWRSQPFYWILQNWRMIDSIGRVVFSCKMYFLNQQTPPRTHLYSIYEIVFIFSSIVIRASDEPIQNLYWTRYLDDLFCKFLTRYAKKITGKLFRSLSSRTLQKRSLWIICVSKVKVWCLEWLKIRVKSERVYKCQTQMLGISNDSISCYKF